MKQIESLYILLFFVDIMRGLIALYSNKKMRSRIAFANYSTTLHVEHCYAMKNVWVCLSSLILHLNKKLMSFLSNLYLPRTEYCTSVTRCCSIRRSEVTIVCVHYNNIYTRSNHATGEHHSCCLILIWYTMFKPVVN